MRLLTCLLAVVVCACRATSTPDRHAPTSTGSTASGADPWASSSGGGSKVDSSSNSGGTGWAEPEPTWAHDPPDVLRAKILGVNAHIVVLKSVVDFAEYRDVLAVVEKTPGVSAAEPFIFMETNIAGPKQKNVGVALKAVDPKRVGRVLDLPKHLKTGTIEMLASSKHSILLGDVLADKLGVKIGNEVTVTPPSTDGPQWKATKLRVAGTFHVEFDEYDERLGYVSIAIAQAMLGRGDTVMGIEATVADLEQSDKTAQVIERALGGPPYQAVDWYELNKNLFTALYGDRRP